MTKPKKSPWDTTPQIKPIPTPYQKAGKRGLAKARAQLGLDPAGNPKIDLFPDNPEPEPNPGRFTDL